MSDVATSADAVGGRYSQGRKEAGARAPRATPQIEVKSHFVCIAVQVNPRQRV